MSKSYVKKKKSIGPKMDHVVYVDGTTYRGKSYYAIFIVDKLVDSGFITTRPKDKALEYALLRFMDIASKYKKRSYEIYVPSKKLVDAIHGKKKTNATLELLGKIDEYYDDLDFIFTVKEMIEFNKPAYYCAEKLGNTEFGRVRC